MPRIKWNLNHYIYFKPREAAGLIWLRYHANLGVDAPPLERGKDGFVKIQAWEFMQVFGEHMGIGMNSPASPVVEIEVDSEDA